MRIKQNAIRKALPFLFYPMKSIYSVIDQNLCSANICVSVHVQYLSGTDPILNCVYPALLKMVEKMAIQVFISLFSILILKEHNLLTTP